MFRKNLFSLLLISAFCSCSTPYQPYKAGPGGYYQKKLSDNSYIIGFASNGNTQITETKRFVLLRASEVALENDNKYFSIDETIRYTSDFLSDWERYYEPGSIASPKLIPWTFESKITLYKVVPNTADKIVYNALDVKSGISAKEGEKKETTWEKFLKRL